MRHAFLGALLLTAGCTGVAFADAIEVTRHEAKVAPGARVTVDSDGGSITVRPGPAGMVKVEAERHAASAEAARALDVQVREVAGGVQVSYKRTRTRGERVAFTIEAPADAALALATGGGSIDVRGTTAGVDARSGGGSVHVADVRGRVRARTGGGSISVERVDGTVDATSGGGSITVAAARLRGDNAVETGGGSVDVRLPDGARLRVEGATGGGGVHNDFGWPAARTGGAGRFSGVVGDGAEGTLKIRTGGGSISVRRG